MGTQVWEFSKQATFLEGTHALIAMPSSQKALVGREGVVGETAEGNVDGDGGLFKAGPDLSLIHI